MDNLKTIRNDANAIVEEKKSKFIANIFKVDTVEEAEKKLEEVRKKYYDARHNCYAYIIKEDNIKKKFSDDGEPSGTEGSPILNVIEKNNLCNVLIIVTRYFGGILLGAGGLVRAYTEAATKSVENAEIVEQELGYELEITIKYQDLEKLKYYCNKNNIRINSLQYGENIKCNIEMPKVEKENILPENGYNTNFVKILKYKIIKEKYIRK